jgi:hypothetical protein
MQQAQEERNYVVLGGFASVFWFFSAAQSAK